MIMSLTAGRQSHILILAPLRQGCGNNTTAARIKYYLDIHSIKCTLKGCDQFKDGEGFKSYLLRENVTAVIALHALHSGKWLHHLDYEDISYALIFGGTDLNLYSEDEGHRVTMTQVVTGASFLVCFSQQMKNQALSIWPSIDVSRVLQIPQGNRLSVAPKSVFSRPRIGEELRLRYNLEADSILFTLVAGIRPVKDPMYLLKHFSSWHLNVNQKCYLVVAGPVLDQVYFDQFNSVASVCLGVRYLGVLSPMETHSLMRDSFAVVNSSLSEGMSVAILEAMELGVPVLARDIPGNQSVIQHGENGLLYNTPQEFIDCATSLLSDPLKHSSMCAAGQTYVREQHNSVEETQAYVSLVRRLDDLHPEVAGSVSPPPSCNNNEDEKTDEVNTSG